MNYLDWCKAFTHLKALLESQFARLGYQPFFSATVQPSIGFDPSNQVLKLSDRPLYLRTSPEREMKIALQRFGTSLYEIGKVFRGGTDNATGPIHQEEFWMCEFYKIHATVVELTQDLQSLLKKCWQHYRPTEKFRLSEVRFDQLFQETCQADLTSWLAQRSPKQALDDLDFIYADRLQPALASHDGFVILSHFPYPLCALAQGVPETHQAPWFERRYQRIELSYQGIELLNGYQEIELWDELHERLQTTEAFVRHARQNNGSLMDPVYEAILRTGLPTSAGCALGLDRLLMILLKTQRIWTHTASKS